jgi:hypothetical protein
MGLLGTILVDGLDGLDEGGRRWRSGIKTPTRGAGCSDGG